MNVDARVLGIETATEACSAALSVDGAVLGAFELAPRRHTELILPMVASLLAQAGLKPAQLDCIAFGAGPGAFTGVRLATSIAQGLALPHDIPTLAVSSLEVLAVGATRRYDEHQVLATFDARRGEVYWGAYSVGAVAASGPVKCAVAAIDRVGVADSIALEATAWRSCGTGVAAYPAIAQRFPQLDANDTCYPDASDLVRLALGRLEQATAPDAAAPVYFRPGV